MAAMGDRTGIWLVVLCVPLQMATISLAAMQDGAGLAAVLSLKLACQGALLLALTLRLASLIPSNLNKSKGHIR